jgi:hypothetical protein
LRKAKPQANNFAFGKHFDLYYLFEVKISRQAFEKRNGGKKAGKAKSAA